MTFQITVPSKTFLLGEYVALKGGPTLILSTEPRFKLIAALNPSKITEPTIMHPESPAGKLVSKYKDFYQNYTIQFIDPYRGLGGFGASTAQFVTLVALKNYIQSTEIKPFELLKEYKKLAWDGEGMAPSGADLISQLYGQLCYFQQAKTEIQSFTWPFEELEYGLIHTGNKLATHTHLKGLSNLNIGKLEETIMAGVKSIEQKESHLFIEAIKNYATLLQAQGLMAKTTEDMLKELNAYPDIVAAKGCGALGADVILILFKKNKECEVINWVKERNLNMIAYGYKLAKGLNIKEET
jgi:mevalonate kinase